MHQRTQAVLQRVVAHGISFADQNGSGWRQGVAAVDGALERIEHVVAVQHGLPHQGAARVKIALHIALVDAGKLLRHGGHQQQLVVHTGQTQVDKRYATVRLLHHGFGRRLGARVSPARADRMALVDALAGAARRMHQHGAGIHKLFYFKGLQRTQQMARAVNIDALVARVVGIAEIKIRHQVHHAGDACAIGITQPVQRQIHRCR